MKLVRKIIIFIFIFFTLTILAVSYWGYQKFKTYKNPQTQVVRIEKGSSVKKIATRLTLQKVIFHPLAFELYVRVQNMSAKLKAGEYEFNKGVTLEQVAEQMALGKVKVYQFTIPEGFNIKDICRVFRQKNLLTVNECQKQVKRTELLQLQDTGVQTLEGYLFPETYAYYYDTDPKTLIPQMVKMFYARLESSNKAGSSRLDRAKELGLTPHQLIILASIVEKETGKAIERPLIASVFFNRLKLGMLLQSDPTVIYGISDFNGNIRKSHLEQDTPYTTYTRPGLPAGPICSVGLDAIDAVLYPDKTEFLYFVAKGDGSHYFSTTLEQHNQAVQYYQLGRGNAPE